MKIKNCNENWEMDMVNDNIICLFNPRLNYIHTQDKRILGIYVVYYNLFVHLFLSNVLTTILCR